MTKDEYTLTPDSVLLSILNGQEAEIARLKAELRKARRDPDEAWTDPGEPAVTDDNFVPEIEIP